mgnify:CR=1 FL=1
MRFIILLLLTHTTNRSYSLQVKINYEIIGINQVSTPLNVTDSFPEETWAVFGSFSKTIKKIKKGKNISGSAYFLSLRLNCLNSLFIVNSF